MHKKSAIFSYALSRSPTKGLCEYMKRKCAHMGASPLTHTVRTMKNWSYFRRTVCSVDATLSNAVGGGSESLPSVHRPMSFLLLDCI